MKKFIASLISDFSSKEIFLSAPNSALHPSVNFQRTSPIFLTNDVELHPQELKDGKLLLIYTLDAFFMIGRLNHFFISNKDVFIFQTLGLGSVLVYSKDGNINFRKLIERLNDNIIGFEIWKISNNIIELEEKNVNPLEKVDRLNLDLDLLSSCCYEDKIIINEIIPSFNFFQSFINTYIPEYKKFSVELEKSIFDLYYSLLLLTKIISPSEFEKYSELLYNSTEIAKKTIDSYTEIDGDQSQIIARHFQLRDELIQISAILRTINTQAFYGLNCFENGYTRTGNNSLFGTGFTYASIFCLYEYIRDIFINNINLKKIKEKYSDFPAPPLMNNPVDVMPWRKSLKSLNRNLDFLSNNEKENGYYHLIYFSNRLGYRETKRSLSVAQQSMYLGALPSWSLNTFTHEFTHAHVRGLLSIAYPIKIHSENVISSKLYSIYEKRIKKPNGCDNLLEFINVSFLNIANNLRSIDCLHNENAKTYPKETITKSLKQYYYEIDETIVHILDFQYFYSATPEIFIKSIWTSWLTLPFTLSRVQEYLTRSIVAIASKETETDIREQINYAIDTVRKELTELKKYEFVDKRQIEIVLQELEKNNFKEKFLREFYEAWGQLTDIVMNYLYKSSLKDALHTDFFNEFSYTGDYKYLVKEGEYKEFRIDSPIKFLNYLLFNSFYNKNTTIIDIEDVEANTSWILSVINSKLLNK